MQRPVQVTFRNMTVSDALEAACWAEADKLEQYFNRITGCRIVVDRSHQRHRKGNLFEIRIDLSLPGDHVIVNRQPPAHQTDEDVWVAVREAFDTARRRLEDYARKRNGRVKTHESPPLGRVVRILPGDDYGFLETTDGREVYFHRNSVLRDAFDRLVVGSEVHFGEETGDKGPQASFVDLAGWHQPASPN
ncbi:MAG: HPF/RaiA family ribosome-associated protein [Planctomycetota bacterium]